MVSFVLRTGQKIEETAGTSSVMVTIPSRSHIYGQIGMFRYRNVGWNNVWDFGEFVHWIWSYFQSFFYFYNNYTFISGIWTHIIHLKYTHVHIWLICFCVKTFLLYRSRNIWTSSRNHICKLYISEASL